MANYVRIQSAVHSELFWISLNLSFKKWVNKEYTHMDLLFCHIISGLQWVIQAADLLVREGFSLATGIKSACEIKWRRTRVVTAGCSIASASSTSSGWWRSWPRVFLKKEIFRFRFFFYKYLTDDLPSSLYD